MKANFLFSCLLFVFYFSATAQEGIILNSADAELGYVLVEYDNMGRTYLIDNCGEIVNSWEVFDTDNHPKLLPNGNLLYMRGNAVIERNWEDEIVISLFLNVPGYALDYEVVKLPNDNYLCVGRKLQSFGEFTEMGYNLTGVFPDVVDVVLELHHTTGEIVWEWNIADHVIQERDANLGNYGMVADNPGLVDMDRVARFDWTGYESFMINGMDYNPDLDQIALSVRKVSEVMIIDHSTTTEEASGHTGGAYGKGGDILYRWGNPQNYGRGTEADRFLFFQHNPNWIQHGADAGKIICYNNGLNRPGTGYYDNYSEVPIINTPEEVDGSYVLPDTGPYLPLAPGKVISGENQAHLFYSPYTSGAEVLSNGNTFITIGQSRRMIELNVNEEIVWDYILPGSGFLFRSEKYAEDYPAFEGKDLIPSGPVPFSNSTYECMQFTSTNTLEASETFSLNYLTPNLLQIYRTDHAYFDYKLIDMNGRLIEEKQATRQQEISLAKYSAGIYIIFCKSADSQEIFVRKIVRH